MSEQKKALDVIHIPIDRCDLQYANELERDSSIENRDGFGLIYESPLQGLAAVARALYLFGLKRSRLFPENLSGEPAWHILLELYASEAEGQTMSLTSASAVSGATESTGLRTVRLLEHTGFVCRTKASRDARRFELRLTAVGRNAVEQALGQMLPTVGPALASLVK